MSDKVDLQAIAAALAAPFDPSEVKFKPQAVSGNRALALPYVDARVIQDRLDDVLGVLGWCDSYECLPDGAVVCRLRIRVGGEWITKEDVGGQSEQPDEGDRRKASFSDALKRAAVKFGLGRYLYRQKPQWCDYDPQKRQFVKPPALPVFGHPPRAAQAATPPPPPPPKEKPTPPPAQPLPMRVAEFEAALLADGLCQAGDVKSYLMDLFAKEYPGRIDSWPEEARPRVKAACIAYRKQQQAKADAAGEKITTKEMDALEDELSRTGVRWETIQRSGDIRKGAAASDLTVAQWRRVMAKLEGMPMRTETVRAQSDD
jgi:hypothetical protein